MEKSNGKAVNPMPTPPRARRILKIIVEGLGLPEEVLWRLTVIGQALKQVKAGDDCNSFERGDQHGLTWYVESAASSANHH